MTPMVGETIYVLHGLATWRKACVVKAPTSTGGELIARWGNILLRPKPGCWKPEFAQCATSTSS